MAGKTPKACGLVHDLVGHRVVCILSEGHEGICHASVDEVAKVLSTPAEAADFRQMMQTHTKPLPLPPFRCGLIHYILGTRYSCHADYGHRGACELKPWPKPNQHALETDLDSDIAVEDSVDRLRDEVQRLRDTLAQRETDAELRGIEAAALLVENHCCVSSCCDAQPGSTTAQALAESIRNVFTVEEAKSLADCLRLNAERRLDPNTPCTAAHVYYSTGCRHSRHTECRTTCKFCGVGCRCRCHPPAAKK